MTAPVVYPYQRALDEFRREGREPPLLKRMSELISLLDLTTTLGSDEGGEPALDAALLIAMGELQVACGALYVADAAGAFVRRASRGLPASSPAVVECDAALEEPFVPGPAQPGLRQAGLALVCPVRKGGRTIALLGLGTRAEGQAFGREEMGFLASLAACAATPIENSVIHDELRRLNRSLSVKVFQLESLFDIGRELFASLDEDAAGRLLLTTLLGHFLASRGALLRPGADGALELAQGRGLRPGEGERLLPLAEAARRELAGPARVEALAPGSLRATLEEGRFALAVPLTAGGGSGGMLLVGERLAGRPYGDEDLDFAAGLARQAQAALDIARLHRLRVEKERQDRELQIARRIQQSLFPKRLPTPPGFELAALSRSCHEVGGDYYDCIPLDRGRLALVIADVSGKGTPASLMMASVHASLQALAGTSEPTRVLERLNRFVYETSQDSRYVTLFYGELDPLRRSLVYVGAGHVPPYLLRSDGSEERLRNGGPVIGLIEDVSLEASEVSFGPGDLLGVVTDGVTEAVSVAGEEFGDSRAAEALAADRSGAQAALSSLVAAVDAWTGAAGCADDLTVLTLRAC